MMTPAHWLIVRLLAGAIARVFVIAVVLGAVVLMLAVLIAGAWLRMTRPDVVASECDDAEWVDLW
jgi:hypothetical protein